MQHSCRWNVATLVVRRTCAIASPPSPSSDASIGSRQMRQRPAPDEDALEWTLLCEAADVKDARPSTPPHLPCSLVGCEVCGPVADAGLQRELCSASLDDDNTLPSPSTLLLPSSWFLRG